MPRSTWRAWFVAIALLASSSRAAGQGEQTYETAIRDALAAQAAARYEEAHALFERAHALEPSARTLRGMGVASFQAGQPMRAVAELEAALAHSNKPLDPALAAAARSLLDRARKQLARVQLEVTPAQARLRIDDAVEDRDAAGELLLLPGEHRLQLTAPGFVTQHLGLEARAGTSQRLRITLVAEQVVVAEPPPAAAIAPAADAGPRAEIVRPRQRAWRIASFSALALGTASAAAALWMYYGVGQRRVDRITEQCAALPEGGCTEEELDTRTRRAGLRTLAKQTTALWITAGVLGAAGGLMLVLTPRGQSAASRPVSVYVGLHRRF